jgi:hypothetical protein
MTEHATLTTIDPDGDVWLELAKGDSKVRLRVSSNVLRLVSPVFAAMFKFAFKEGIGLAQHSLAVPVIPLPEDDPDIFTLLCKVVHYQINGVPHSLSPACLEKLAIVYDKYGCVSALQHSSIVWLSRIGSDMWRSPNENLKLLHAAYTLDVPEAFARVSGAIIAGQKGWLDEPVRNDIVQHDLQGEAHDLPRPGTSPRRTLTPPPFPGKPFLEQASNPLPVLAGCQLTRCRPAQHQKSGHHCDRAKCTRRVRADGAPRMRSREIQRRPLSESAER